MKKLFIFVVLLAVLITAVVLVSQQQNTYRLPDGELTVYSYSKDDVYILRTESAELERLVLEAVNPNTFTPTGINWGKDNDLIFYKEKQVVGADAETFEIIDESWAKDADSLYYQFIKIPNAKQPSFIPLTEDDNFLAKIIRDDKKVYLYKPHRLALRETLIPIPELSPDTLSFIDKSGFYIKDQDSVIYVNINSDKSPHYKVLDGADAETFTYYAESEADAKDKNFTYRYGQIISE